MSGRSRHGAPDRKAPEDAIEDASVVHARNATRLVREHPFDDPPFAVAEFIAHDSMLPFGSVNHAKDHGINGQTACPLSGASGPTAGTAKSTAIDPQQTSFVR